MGERRSELWANLVMVPWQFPSAMYTSHSAAFGRLAPDLAIKDAVRVTLALTSSMSFNTLDPASLRGELLAEVAPTI